jgi:hypothetical protein
MHSPALTSTLQHSVLQGELGELSLGSDVVPVIKIWIFSYMHQKLKTHRKMIH